MTYVELVKNVRQHLSITQSDLAQLVGVHAQTVSKWERGLTTPTLHQEGILEALERAPKQKNGNLHQRILKRGGVSVLVVKLSPR